MLCMGEVLDDGEKEYRYLLAQRRLDMERKAERATPWLIALYFLWIPLAILLFVYLPEWLTFR